MGQEELALESAQEAVQIYRKLAQTAPTKQEDLVEALDGLVNNLSALGHLKAALDSQQDAVQITRELAKTDPKQNKLLPKTLVQLGK